MDTRRAAHALPKRRTGPALYRPRAKMGALAHAEAVKRAREELDDKLIEGLESGRAEPMTDKSWEDVRRRAWMTTSRALPTASK